MDCTYYLLLSALLADTYTGTTLAVNQAPVRLPRYGIPQVYMALYWDI